MEANVHDMTELQKLSFSTRYIALYEQSLETADVNEYKRLKAEMIQMEIEAGLYGQL